jgi:N-acetylmuramoyl-L-alanine amidase
MPGDSALTGAPGTREPAPAGTWINRDGFAVLDRMAGGTLATPLFPGFRLWARSPATDRDPTPAFVAIAGGALHGRRITLDPDGGGDQSGGLGPGGTRAANLNLEVARALAGMLAVAGAEARLTRDGDVALSELERVQINEAFHADRFVRIGHRAEPPRIGYYVASASGRRWALHLAEGCALMGLATPRVAEDAQYPLQQTSCPSLYASLGRVDTPESEARLVAPASARAEAWALFVGIAREWTAGTDWSADSVRVEDHAGTPVSGAVVRLGGALLAETDARGIARFVRTEPGPIAARVHHPRVAAAAVLLDSEHGIVLTGPSEP